MCCTEILYIYYIFYFLNKMYIFLCVYPLNEVSISLNKPQKLNTNSYIQKTTLEQNTNKN